MFWVLAVVCWINDRIFCSLWSSVGFPYLHAAWHILVFLASHTAVVIFAFFEAKQRRSELRPEIRFVDRCWKFEENHPSVDNDSV